MSELYPESYQTPAMKIWSLPKNKEHLFPQICEKGEYFAQEKKDGSWYQFERTESHMYLFGRSKSVTTKELTEKSANVPHIIDALSCLPAGTILIGEVYYPGGESRDTTKIMGCLPNLAIKRQKDNPIHYYIHDIIRYNNKDLINVAAWKRYLVLKAIWKKYNLSEYDFLDLAEVFDTDIEDHLARILASGGEGIVMKKKTLPYYPDKRPAWSTIKRKKMDTVDLVCIGFCDATREYTGKLDLQENYCGADADEWPYWAIFENNVLKEFVPIAEQKVYDDDTGVLTLPVTKGYYYGWKTAMRVGAYDENGKSVEVGTVSSGLTDKDRELMATQPELYLNHVFCFDCMERNNADRTLRHPIFIGPREDKNAEDCLLKEIFV